MVWSLIAGRNKRFSFSQKKNIQPGSGDHLLLSSAEVKNEWSCTTAHPICLHGMDRDNFTFVTIEKVMWLYNP